MTHWTFNFFFATAKLCLRCCVFQYQVTINVSTFLALQLVLDKLFFFVIFTYVFSKFSLSFFIFYQFKQTNKIREINSTEREK